MNSIHEARIAEIMRDAYGVISDLEDVARCDNPRLFARSLAVSEAIRELGFIDPQRKVTWGERWLRLRHRLTYKTIWPDPGVEGMPILKERLPARLYWKLRPSKRPRNLVENPSFESDDLEGWSSTPAAFHKGATYSTVLRIHEGETFRTDQQAGRVWHHVSFSAMMKVEGEADVPVTELAGTMLSSRFRELSGLPSLPVGVAFYVDAFTLHAAPMVLSVDSDTP